MEHFEIQLSNPSATFEPEQSVSGWLIIRSSEPIKDYILKIRLNGETIFGALKVVHVDISNRLRGSADGPIPTGINTIPFSLKLPSDCPPSFENKHGSIQYKLSAVITRNRTPDCICELSFTVLSHLDLDEIDGILRPVEDNKKLQYRRFLEKNEELRMKTSIPKKAYSVGESIPISIKIQNNTDLQIDTITIKLVQTMYSDTGINEKETELLEMRKYLERQIVSETLKFRLVIPKTAVPSFKAHLIQMTYKIVVDIGKLRTLECQMPIIIGNAQVVEEEPLPPPIPRTLPPPTRIQPPSGITMGFLPPSYEEAMNSDVHAPPRYEE